MTVPEVGIDAALRLARAGDVLTAEIAPSWTQGRTAFGGLSAALMLRAIGLEVPEERRVRSVLVDFAGPVAPGDITISVRALRVGKTFSHFSAELRQADATCATMTAVFAADRSTSLSFPAPHALPPKRPEELRPTQYIEGVLPRFILNFDLRWASPHPPFSGSDRPEICGFVRHAPHGPSDAAGIVALLDTWPPAVLPMLRAPAPASTVTWMVDFAHLPGPTTPRDAFFYYEGRALAAGEGCATTEARLWGPDGAFVCASRQLVAEFSKPA